MPKRMQIPSRTNATDLTSDELLLFDFLFDKRLTFRQLRKDDYPFHMNCGYSHGLDDDKLQSVLDFLLVRGLLRRKTEPIFRPETQSCLEGDLYWMTKAGGELWERERVPDWNRFLCSAHWERRTGRGGVTRVVCADEGIAKMCMGAMYASGLITPIGRLRLRTIWDARLLPWKTFPQVHSIRCKTKEDTDDLATDWDVYHKMRCWWEDIHELNSLHQGARQ